MYQHNPKSRVSSRPTTIRSGVVSSGSLTASGCLNAFSSTADCHSDNNATATATVQFRWRSGSALRFVSRPHLCRKPQTGRRGSLCHPGRNQRSALVKRRARRTALCKVSSGRLFGLARFLTHVREIRNLFFLQLGLLLSEIAFLVLWIGVPSYSVLCWSYLLSSKRILPHRTLPITSATETWLLAPICFRSSPLHCSDQGSCRCG